MLEKVGMAKWPKIYSAVPLTPKTCFFGRSCRNFWGGETRLGSQISDEGGTPKIAMEQKMEHSLHSGGL